MNWNASVDARAKLAKLARVASPFDFTCLSAHCSFEHPLAQVCWQ